MKNKHGKCRWIIKSKDGDTTLTGIVADYFKQSPAGKVRITAAPGKRH